MISYSRKRATVCQKIRNKFCQHRTQQQARRSRQKSVADELAAIAKAKEVLSSGVSVLLQVQRSAGGYDGTLSPSYVAVCSFVNCSPPAGNYFEMNH